MKRTILGNCYLATLCAVALTGFAGSGTTTVVTTPEAGKANDQKIIEDLRIRVEKLELFSAARTIEGGSYYDNMPFVIKLSRQGNRFADQWVGKRLANINTNSSQDLIAVAAVYSSDPDANVRDKVKALHYAMMAYSLATNRIGSAFMFVRGMNDDARPEVALEALAAAYAINGDYKKAIELEEKAMAIISTDANFAKYLQKTRDSILSDRNERIELYKRGLPYIREKWTLPEPELGSEH